MKHSVKKLVLLTALPSLFLAGTIPMTGEAQAAAADKAHDKAEKRKDPASALQTTHYLLKWFEALIRQGEANPTLRFYTQTGVPSKIVRDVKTILPDYEVSFKTQHSKTFELPRRVLPRSQEAHRIFVLQQELQPRPGSTNPQKIILNTVWALPKPGSNTPASPAIVDSTGPDWIAIYDQLKLPDAEVLGDKKLEGQHKLKEVTAPLGGLLDFPGSNRVEGSFTDRNHDGRAFESETQDLYRAAVAKLAAPARARITTPDHNLWVDRRAWQLFKPLAPANAPAGGAEDFYLDLPHTNRSSVDILGSFMKNKKKYTVVSFFHWLGGKKIGKNKGSGLILTFWLLPEDQTKEPRILLIPPGYKHDHNLQLAATDQVQQIIDSINSGQEHSPETRYIHRVVKSIEDNEGAFPEAEEAAFADHGIAVVSASAAYGQLQDFLVPYDPAWLKNYKQYMGYAENLVRNPKQEAPAPPVPSPPAVTPAEPAPTQPPSLQQIKDRILPPEKVWQDTLAWQLAQPLHRYEAQGRNREADGGLYIDFSREPRIIILGQFTKNKKEHTLIALDQHAVSYGEKKPKLGMTRSFWAVPHDPKEAPYLMLIPAASAGSQNTVEDAATRVKRVAAAIQRAETNGQVFKRSAPESSHGIAILVKPEQDRTYSQSLVPHDEEWATVLESYKWFFQQENWVNKTDNKS